VPAPQVVGVVTFIGVSCSLPEVLEVACCPFGFVLVIAWDGLGALLEAPPRRPVAFLKVRLRALGVGLIAQSENRPVDTLDQLSGSLVALGVAIGDASSRSSASWRRRLRSAAGYPWGQGIRGSSRMVRILITPPNPSLHELH
jgi:hypothetical protein